MRLLFTFLLFLVTIGSYSQEKIELESFDGIVARGNFSMKLVKSDANYVTIEDTDELTAEDFQVKYIKDNRMYIKLKNDLFEEREVDLTLYYAQDVNFIEAKSGMVIQSDDFISSSDLELICFAGGEIHIAVKTDNLITSVKQGGKIKLTGEAKNHTAKVTTGGKIKAYKVTNQNTEANVKAGGRIEVTPIESLNATVFSGGNIYYRGNPENLTKDVKLGGNIEKK